MARAKPGPFDQEIIPGVSTRIVVKLGTSTLTAGTPKLNRRRMLELVQQVVAAREAGAEIVLVSSGAMAAGRERLGVARADQPPEMAFKQMLAAVGQTHLMLAWEQLFGLHEVQVAQVLLTRADLSDRRRYLNARDALSAILAHGIVPIINENDAVATEEIKVGDNDNLSALVTNLLNAEILLMLTDQEGLFTADPRKDASARLLAEVPEINDAVYAMAGASRTGLGTGGMTTKLQAAELATRSGAAVVIANGARPGVIADVARGVAVGTRIAAAVTRVEARKRWILAERPAGAIVVDDGAARAVARGKSLLPVGAREVIGDFERGEVVALRNARGRDIALGIVRYSAADARRVLGKQSEAIARLLGEGSAPILVHADDLVVVTAER